MEIAFTDGSMKADIMEITASGRVCVRSSPFDLLTNDCDALTASAPSVKVK